MKSFKTVITVICLFFFALSVASCSTLARRKPLEITPYNQQLSLTGMEDLNLVFEEVIPGKPLNETVWDNAKGPFWDVEESKQIGFTQDYSKFIPVAASAGVIGGAIGGAIAGVAVGPDLVNTRIVIPFGNDFSTTLDSAIQKNVGNHTVCFQPQCSSSANAKNVLKIKINEFYVWEGPLNHLNLVVKGNAVLSKDGKVAKDYAFEKAMLSQKLGTMMSTHAMFMREMNRLTNELAQNVSTEILNNINE